MSLSSIVRPAVLLAALACASPATAQIRLAIEPHSAIAFEAGFFTYGKDRYPNDFEVAFHAAAGWRYQERGFFVEPHVRAMISDRRATSDDLCDDVLCAGGGGANETIPLLWPGVTTGIAIGDDYFSSSLAARVALGVGPELQPLVGLRYEGSARWMGWFIEASAERVPWSDGERRWQPGLSVGARWWARSVTVPAPNTMADAGIIPETFHESADAEASEVPAGPEQHLAVWASDEDSAASFVAFIDIDPASAQYGRIVRTLTVGERGAHAHHSEMSVRADGRMWVNTFDDGRTYLLDLAEPNRPTIAGRLAEAPGLSHPHSIVRVESGNVLVTYQMNADGTGPGGLALHAPDGSFIRGGSAEDPASDAFVRPYSAVVLPHYDRVLTTGADMHDAGVSRAVQLWRLSDLRLLSTLELPAGPAGTENEHTFEPRIMPDGSVFVITLGCGLYRIDGIDAGRLRGTLVHRFEDTRCFMPVVIGYWWIQTLARENAIEVLDMTHPDAPRVRSRLALPDDWSPHWLAADASGDRIALTGYRAMNRRVVMLRFDRRSGSLTIDPAFGGGDGAPGTEIGGPDGAALPHAAVFVP